MTILLLFKERLIYEKADKIDPASGMAIKEKLVRRVMDCGNELKVCCPAPCAVTPG